MGHSHCSGSAVCAIFLWPSALYVIYFNASRRMSRFPGFLFMMNIKTIVMPIVMMYVMVTMMGMMMVMMMMMMMMMMMIMVVVMMMMMMVMDDDGDG